MLINIIIGGITNVWDSVYDSTLSHRYTFYPEVFSGTNEHMASEHIQLHCWNSAGYSGAL